MDTYTSCVSICLFLKVIIMIFGDAIRNEYDNVLDDRDMVIVHLEVFPINDSTTITSQVRKFITNEYGIMVEKHLFGGIQVMSLQAKDLSDSEIQKTLHFLLVHPQLQVCTCCHVHCYKLLYCIIVRLLI